MGLRDLFKKKNGRDIFTGQDLLPEIPSTDMADIAIEASVEQEAAGLGEVNTSFKRPSVPSEWDTVICDAADMVKDGKAIAVIMLDQFDKWTQYGPGDLGELNNQLLSGKCAFCSAMAAIPSGSEQAIVYRNPDPMFISKTSMMDRMSVGSDIKPNIMANKSHLARTIYTAAKHLGVLPLVTNISIVSSHDKYLQSPVEVNPRAEIEYNAPGVEALQGQITISIQDIARQCAARSEAQDVAQQAHFFTPLFMIDLYSQLHEIGLNSPYKDAKHLKTMTKEEVASMALEDAGAVAFRNAPPFTESAITMAINDVVKGDAERNANATETNTVGSDPIGADPMTENTSREEHGHLQSQHLQMFMDNFLEDKDFGKKNESPVFAGYPFRDSYDGEER